MSIIKKAKWIDVYSQLEKFVSEKRRLPISSDGESDLLAWVKERQSEIVNNKKTLPERRKLLQKIPGWETAVPMVDEVWTGQLEKVKAFLEQHKRYPELPSESESYAWLKRQRELKLNHEHEHWNVVKEGLLSALPSFYWCADGAHWNYFAELVRASGKTQYQGTDGFEQKLFKWLANQRRLYEKDEGLTAEQRQVLEDLYGGKDNMKNDPWYLNFKQLKVWVEENGRLPEQFAQTPEEQSNYKWVCNQKKRNCKSKDGKGLSEEKQQLLQNLPGWDWDLDPLSFWDKMIEECFEHHTKNMGSFKQKKTTLPEEKKVCGWYAFTTTKHRNGVLDETRRAKFEALLGRIKADIEKTVNTELVAE